MTRIQMHRSEYERGWPRLLMMSLIVFMLGLFSCIVIWMIAAESHSGTFAPIAQNRAFEWDPEQWSREAPVAIALVVVPALASLAIGVHCLSHGGILGFLVCLFNLLPFQVSSGTFEASAFRGSPPIWCGFLVGALVAFYIGDLGSWLCRRRLRREIAEDALLAMQGAVDDEDLCL